MKKRVEDKTHFVKEAAFTYVVGLLITKSKKSCVQMGDALEKSHDFLYRCLAALSSLVFGYQKFSKNLITFHAQKKPGIIIFDDTTLSKHARLLKNMCWVFDSSESKVRRGLCLVVVVWSNGLVTIPLGFSWWVQKKVVGEKLYKKKTEIAKALLLQALSLKTSFSHLVFDSLYFTKSSRTFFNEIGAKYVSRAPSNRKFRLTKNGVGNQLKNCKELKLNRNQHSKIVAGFMGEDKVFIVALKREKNSKGYELVFLVSNDPSLLREKIIELYGVRWNIEMLFRTLKQSLGLNHCSARSIECQTYHIYACLTAYCFLQHQKNLQRLANPETVIIGLLELKSIELIRQIYAFFMAFAQTA